MLVEYKGDSISIEISVGGNVINGNNGRVFGTIEKEGLQWVFKFFGNGRMYGETEEVAIQNYFDWKNKLIIICPVCSQCFERKDSVVYNGVDVCIEHGNKNHMMSH